MFPAGVLSHPREVSNYGRVLLNYKESDILVWVLCNMLTDVGALDSGSVSFTDARIAKLSCQCCSNGPGNLGNMCCSNEIQPHVLFSSQYISSAWRQTVTVTGYCFKYIDRPFCLRTDESIDHLIEVYLMIKFRSG